MAHTREELSAQVLTVPETGCWEFTGKLDRYGYGRLYSGDLEQKAHRVFYETWIEQLEPGVFLRHGLGPVPCIGHACCNPFHLKTSLSNRISDTLAPSETYKRRYDLFSRIKVIPETKCWQFQGAKNTAGFGLISQAGTELAAHQVFFEEWIGPLPDGEKLVHFLPRAECIGRACCNPDHIRYSLRTLPPLPKPSTTAVTARPTGPKICPKGHVMTPDNTVIEQRNGHPKARCRTCRQESWRKNAAKRSATGKHS